VHLYYEACDPAGARSTPGQRTCPVGADLLEDGPERGGVEHAPTDGAWAARFRVFQGAPGSKRLVRADVGAELAGATTRIRNVHFSLPRFDDVPDDRRPNQLDEIFPDLGAVISP
jgi:hypothetical protein